MKTHRAWFCSRSSPFRLRSSLRVLSSSSVLACACLPGSHRSAIRNALPAGESAHHHFERFSRPKHGPRRFFVLAPIARLDICGGVKGQDERYPAPLQPLCACKNADNVDEHGAERPLIVQRQACHVHNLQFLKIAKVGARESYCARMHESMGKEPESCVEPHLRLSPVVECLVSNSKVCRTE